MLNFQRLYVFSCFLALIAEMKKPKPKDPKGSRDVNINFWFITTVIAECCSMPHLLELIYEDLWDMLQAQLSFTSTGQLATYSWTHWCDNDCTCLELVLPQFALFHLLLPRRVMAPKVN